MIVITRNERIKDRLFNTEFYTKKEWWGEGLTILTDDKTREEPLIIRKALACAYVLANMPIEVKPDELVVGIARMSMIGFGHTYVEYATEEELTRAAAENLSPLSVWGHQPPNYEDVLKRGLSGLRSDIYYKIDELLPVTAEKREKYNLYRAMLISLDGMSTLSARYAQLCAEAASKESDPDRARELLQLSAICRKVPEKPADTLQEALQSVWFTYLCLQSNMENIPLGRSDQYLYPYYERDVAEGRLDNEKAGELICSFLAKFNERVQMNPAHWENHMDSTTYSFGGDAGDQSLFIDMENDQSYNYGVSANHWDINLIIGGMRPDGKDGTNELTYIFLEQWGFLSVIAPVLSVRFNASSPDRLFRECAKILRCGSGEPVIYNEKPIIDGYVKLGIPVEDARDFSNDGCWETLIPGKSHYSYAHIEVLQLLEYVFQRGYSLVRGVKEGIDTGNPAELTDYESFYGAFRKQLFRQIENLVANRIKFYGASYKIAPDPLMSAMIDGCVESGKDLTAGGAKYTIFSPLITGLADCTDSLAAVKYFVYDTKKLSMEQLVELMRNNFEGNETIRQMLINKAPKFGNDDMYADSIAKQIIADVEAKTLELSKMNPDIYMPLGIGTFENYSKFGHKVGASANGRMSQQPIASNYSPSYGVDKSGPTAAICSAVNSDIMRYITGCPIDLQINSNETEGSQGIDRLVGLMRAFIDLGGIMMTLTGVTEEMLLDAQKNPDKYRSLRVRMGGLSAYFIALPKEMQDTLIRKTKHGI